MEAAACGTPSFASDSPGLRDSVRHGETGFLVPHGDVRAGSRACWSSPTRRSLVARLGERARRLAEQVPWERTAAETLGHLHDIVGGKT